MEAIVGVWLTSLLGAAAFSAAGYILGQRGVYLPFLALPEPAPKPDSPPASAKPDVHTMPTPAVGIPRSDLLPPTVRATEATLAVSPPSEGETPIAPAVAASQRPKASIIPREEPEETKGKRATSATLRPPRTPTDESATNTELKAAREKADAAAQRARDAEAVKLELERQIEALRKELRNEVAARATEAARADELADRLAGASEETAGLRHKVSVLDKQSKQLREALQGRVRALTTSEWHRRRDLEEAEEMRGKLRDVYDKLERSSMAPAAASMPPTSASTPQSKITAPAIPAAQAVLRSNVDETAPLRDEIARLSKENQDLRARALGSMPPKRSDSSPPELDMTEYRALLERVESVAGMRGAVIADETGTLLLGSGEHAEGLAAFGAYIRDASSRTERLLPLEGVEEVDIRDRGGMLLTTRVVSHSPSAVCLVLLGAAEASVASAKKVVKEHLRSRPL